VLAGVRREENAALRKIFESAQAQKLLVPMKFENWLFSLLALSCFYYSNCRTMQYTHDPEMNSPEWKNALIKDASALFVQQKKEDV
ncbi:MAG: hypothetical protein J6R86_08820, partial [Lentisphaeria bacterium]|nr:hypothetical protein [Lentisphaeria bacterium]